MNGWAIVIAPLRDGQTPNAPIVHPKLNTGKEPLKCGMESAPVFAPVFTALRRGELLRRGKECGERPNLISVIAKPRRTASQSGTGKLLSPASVYGIVSL
jgi:hypothetical protein